jgi:hypothetical protein
MGMEFSVKGYGVSPEEVVAIIPEVIAGQRVGSRLEFKRRHDFTVEFTNGAVMIDDVDMMIYVIPNEFFCYRGDDFIMKFVLDTRKVQIDHRPATGTVNARAFISRCSDF